MRQAAIIAAASLAAIAIRAGDEWATGVGQLEQVTSGLVSYWSMRNTGTTVHDEIGANSCTAVNSPTFAYANGVVGNGAGFAGGTDYISVPTTATFAGAAAGSVSLWLKSTGGAGNVRIAYSETTSGSQFGRVMVFFGATETVTFLIRDSTADPSGTAKSVASTSALSADTWYHIVGTFDSVANEIKIYINGTLNNTTSTAVSALGTSATAGIRIGVRADGTLPWTGPIDEVRIYNRALIAAEVAQLYRMGSVRP
jgi:hypothetical protein